MRTVTQRLLPVVIALIALSAATSAQAGAPQLLPFEGYLATSEGVPVEGLTELHFALYDSAEGGIQLFVETQEVDVVGGYFDVLIGSFVPLDHVLFRDYDELYIGVTVESDSELTPRTRLGSVPYAVHAALCGDADTLDGFDSSEFAAADHTHAFSELSDVPADLADGDDDTTYDAGSGLSLSGGLFSIAAGGVGATELATAAVTGAKIADGSITMADLAPMSVATTQLVTDAVTSAKIADGTVAMADLAPMSVGTTQLATDAVTGAKIADGTVGSADLAAMSVDTTQLADGSVTSAKILDGTITSADLAAGAVDTAQLAADAVTGSKIANGSVAQADLALMSVGNGQLATNAVTSAKVQNLSLAGIDMAEGAVGTREAVPVAGTAVAFGSVAIGSTDLLGPATYVSGPARCMFHVSASVVTQVGDADYATLVPVALVNTSPLVMGTSAYAWPQGTFATSQAATSGVVSVPAGSTARFGCRVTLQSGSDLDGNTSNCQVSWFCL